MATPQELVEQAATELSEIEDQLRTVQRRLLAHAGIYQAGHQAAIAGYLQTSHLAARIKAAAGCVAQAEALVFEVHREGTEIAVEKGIDLPQTEGGGGR